ALPWEMPPAGARRQRALLPGSQGSHDGCQRSGVLRLPGSKLRRGPGHCHVVGLGRQRSDESSGVRRPELRCERQAAPASQGADAMKVAPLTAVCVLALCACSFSAAEEPATLKPNSCNADAACGAGELCMNGLCVASMTDRPLDLALQ